MQEDNTREKIINAAKDVFSSKGYTGATTKQISKAAGVAEITLFRHFETKSNLFYETIYKYLVSNVLDFKESDNDLDIKQVIANFIEKRIDTLRKNKDLFICTIYEAQFNDEIKGIFEKIHSKIFEALVIYIKSKDQKNNEYNIEHMAQIFLSTIVGIIIFEAVGGSKEFVDSNKSIEIINALIFN